uniref:Polysaccharide export protein n=1 Tax=Desulfobacca acetoxidans TaxID=60893 RepID=A0A7C3UYR4_9BACT
MPKKIMALGLILLLFHLAAPVWAQEDYRLGPEDEIEIRVWNHDDLTRKVRVGLNGTISFPFIGEIKAQGMTVLDLQRELERRLGPQYIIDPHVSITVAEYKSQKFFVVGNVAKPGTYPLTKPIRVVEAISLAGGMESGAGKGGTGSAIAVIVRAKPGIKRDQPSLPDQTPAGDKVTVSLSAAMAGDPRHNVEIKNGDTIYVPALFYYVQGQVKNAGRYPYEENMTVLMAVTTAGGFTDKAAPKRTYITREKNGTKEQLKVKLEDPIQPGDVVTVPESWF